MTVRHLSGNAQIITLLYRFGHSVSNSVLLELETAMCDKVAESDSCLPKSIDKYRSGVLHFCWDNFDLNEETNTGTGTTHSTHGIVIQEPSSDSNDSIVIQKPSSDSNESESIPQAPNNSGMSSDISSPITTKKKRSATYRPQQLQPCFVKPRAEPIIQIDKKDALAAVTESAALKSDFRWFFLRANFPSKFPHWKGWLYLTSDQTPEHKSTIEYTPPINATINENSTIQEIIQISQNATNEVGQEVTFITFDLAVAQKKAYNILWQRSDLYQNVFNPPWCFPYHTIIS
ncbi:hypothetical protein ElyMa_006065500 [Elysia marginata]|uniref:Uncharacterized protein n=1 Tax=Elysia marginata TaxID=1093978 RepID=A0AAV4GRH8_9GAST|nr:hypothetical protein ElyMa_006065500 [Elysia marginata]